MFPKPALALRCGHEAVAMVGAGVGLGQEHCISPQFNADALRAGCLWQRWRDDSDRLR